MIYLKLYLNINNNQIFYCLFWKKKIKWKLQKEKSYLLYGPSEMKGHVIQDCRCRGVEEPKKVVGEIPSVDFEHLPTKMTHHDQLLTNVLFIKTSPLSHLIYLIILH